ncbi:MAG: citrate synthase [Salinirussus sp.]
MDVDVDEEEETEIRHGLEGVVVDESELSDIDGDAGRLVYRGYAIEDLARRATFEEVLYLLWHGDLPDRRALRAFDDELREAREIDPAVVETLRDLAGNDTDPMAALRTGVSMLSAADPADDAAILERGRRITAKMPTLLAAYDRLRSGADPVPSDDDLGHAANFLYMLTGEVPGDVAAETFDTALTLHADHGLNASTFTAMTVASTHADVYSAVTAGIGALSGPLHGGANQDVMRTLQELDASDRDPVEWTRAALDDGRRIPGWGHRVYQVKDPRAVILEERSADLADSTGERKWHEYTQAIERHLTEEKDLPARGIAPNVDFYSGSVYYRLGIPVDLYTPIFAVSRVAGWIAHVREYRQDNRLIRPRGQYVGPEPEDREFRALGDR